MIELFWACFAGGVLFALVTIFFGDWLQTDHLQFFEPVSVVGGVTVFGGMGILLTRYTPLAAWTIILVSLLVAIAVSLCIYFLYVKRMREAENSTGFSIKELTGRIGEVSTAIPSDGYGEVVIKTGVGLTNQIAASFDKEELPAGTRIVVVEVKDDTLYVSRLDSE